MRGLSCFVYITTNPRETVLYIGVTNDLTLRLNQHFRNRGDKETFAGGCYCYNLVNYEVFADIVQAISGEKEIKNMSREDKESLIKESNPKLEFIKEMGQT